VVCAAKGEACIKVEEMKPAPAYRKLCKIKGSSCFITWFRPCVYTTLKLWVLLLMLKRMEIGEGSQMYVLEGIGHSVIHKVIEWLLLLHLTLWAPGWNSPWMFMVFLCPALKV
jgi:hypothetical protein